MEHLFFGFLLFDYIENSTTVVVALQCPRIGILGSFEDGYSPCSFLRDMVIDIFAVHIFLCKIAAFILEDLAVQRQNLGKETDFHLFFQLV